MDVKKRIRYTAALLMAFAMVGTAQWTGEREILFPEMMALCIGLWVVDKPVWAARRWQIVALMTLGAVAGVCLVRYSPWPYPVNFCLAFAFAGACLFFSRTTLIPLLSACMLPVLLHTQSWIYPAAVCSMSLAVVAGQKCMEHWGVRTCRIGAPAAKADKKGLLRWGGLLCCVAGAVSLAVFTGGTYLVIPPLVVTFVEMVNSKAGFRYRPVQVFSILVAAVFMGTGAQYFGYYLLHLPQSVVALLIAGALFLLFERIGKYFAPAGALSFIPMLVPREALAWLPLQVAAGAALFIAAALIVFMRCYKWTHAQRVYCLTPSLVRERLSRPGRNS